jgi:hypothetical protein
VFLAIPAIVKLILSSVGQHRSVHSGQTPFLGNREEKRVAECPLGSATISPSNDVVAGALGTWRLTFSVGGSGLASGGRIRVHTDTDTDWGVPQFVDATADDYATLQRPRGSSLHVLIEGHRSLLIVNDGRALELGEEIVVTLGDRSWGSGGSRAQTFQEENHYFLFAVDLTGDGTFTELPDPPSVRVIGGEPASLVVLAPSLVEVGERFDVCLKVEDAWGNPTTLSGAIADLDAEGVWLPVGSYTFRPQDGEIGRLVACRCKSVGVHGVRARLRGEGLQATSNPILCVEKRGAYGLYWGDPHGGQLVSARKIQRFFRFARDIARLDFVGYQRNDHQLSDEDWAAQQKAEREFYEPSRFVPLPGYEWSGPTEAGGHHNVYFRQYGRAVRRCRQDSLGGPSDANGLLPHIRDVYEFYRDSDVLLTPHVGGNHADLSFHEPSLEPAIEVVSTHGTFEWFLEEALRRGYRVGVVGGSDGYTGRPGAEYPGRQDRRYAKGGLTALYAEDLSLESVFDALRARRCYATTGARILVQFEADGHMIGEEYTTEIPPTLSVRVSGESPIEAVEVFRGLARIAVFPKDERRDENRLRITWEGASRESSYSGVVWDGVLRLNKATIEGVRTLRFDSPRSSAHQEGRHSLRWHSVSCGYRTGIEVQLEEVADVSFELSVQTALITRPRFGGLGALSPVRTPLRRTSYAPAERITTRLRLSELASCPRVLNLGALGRRIVMSLAPRHDASSVVELAFQDRSIYPGLNPYWIRVTQEDLEMAWTSPVFVNFHPLSADPAGKD